MNTYAVTADTMLIGKNMEVLQQGCILISDGIIRKITTIEEFKKQNTEQCTVIDLGSKTVLPGLIECHTHLCLDAKEPEHLEALANGTECEFTLTALKGLQDDLQAGITTARCLGDREYIDLTMRKLVKQGKVQGPKLVCAGIGMRGAGGFSYLGYPQSGVEDIRRTCRQNIQKGVDLFKLFLTPGLLATGSAFIPCHMSPEEIHTSVEEAARVNLTVTAHCIGGEGIRHCAGQGVDVIEHAYFVSDEEIETILKHNTWVGLTSGIYLDPEREATLSPANIEKTRWGREKVRSCLSKLVKAGARYTLGTDANHGLLYKEAEYAVALGSDPLTALKGLTSNAAEVCRIADQTGSLEEGLCADIIAVEYNPLNNISALRNVSFVMQDGIPVIQNPS